MLSHLRSRGETTRSRVSTTARLSGRTIKSPHLNRTLQVNAPLKGRTEGAIKTVGVIGAGTMGHGIAQVLLRSGYSVRLFDSSAESLERGAAKIRAGLNRDVEKGRLVSQDLQGAL